MNLKKLESQTLRYKSLSLFLQPLNQATYKTGLSIVDDDFDKVADDKESLLRDLNEEVNFLNTEDDVEATDDSDHLNDMRVDHSGC